MNSQLVLVERGTWQVSFFRQAVARVNREESPNTAGQSAIRKGGRRFRKGSATESVTEKKPPPACGR
ncbi:MAG: hypothetical protein OHK005_18350 [Candidatus Methylacidiphilales bacterium]